MTKTASKILLVLALVVALLGTAAYLYLHWDEVSTDDAAIAGRTVVISPKVAGYVQALYVNDNQLVKTGDVLLEIDPTDFTIRRDQAKAALEASKAAALASATNLQTINVSAPSNLDAAKAQLEVAKANWDKAVADLKRMQSLSRDARSQEQLDQAVATEKARRSAVDEAEARLRTAETAPHTIAQAEATMKNLEAQVGSAEAALAQAERDLANTKLVAAMNGRVTKRGVEKGNFVQPGQALMTLVSNDLWVVANFKETQLRHMKPGQRVRIKVDAYPDLNLSGKVDSVQSGTGAYFSIFPPENATGNFVKIVQRVPVKIVFDQLPEASYVLGPGMSVIPTVDVGDP